tara:strand:+ start:171 stop:533 length:363 start_codon:yes stop_codon:yes gene_type:complete
MLETVDFDHREIFLPITAYAVVDLSDEADVTVAITDDPDIPGASLVWVLESSDDELNEDYTDGEWFTLRVPCTYAAIEAEVRRRYARIVADAEQDQRAMRRQMALECSYDCDSYNDYMGY